MTTVLFHFAMKKINMIIIITRGFYRRRKHEEARRVNYQFKVDEGQLYANIGEVLDPPPPNSHRQLTIIRIKKMSARSTRQLTTKMRIERCLRISRMQAPFGYSSGKAKGRGIGTPSGSKI